jgi:hypothetical protein
LRASRRIATHRDCVRDSDVAGTRIGHGSAALDNKGAELSWCNNEWNNNRAATVR